MGLVGLDAHVSRCIYGVGGAGGKHRDDENLERQPLPRTNGERFSMPPLLT